MTNELLILIMTVTAVGTVWLAARNGLSWLLSTIVLNLLLAGIFGFKLISFFGLTIDASGVFYAAVFLATHFIIEQSGKKEGFKTIWYGALAVLFFVATSKMIVLLVGLPVNDVANQALQVIFNPSVRVTLASILSYIFAQYINVAIFSSLKEKTKNKYLWLRSVSANVVAQLADSILFFSIAFFDLSGPALVRAIVAGWLLKSIVVLVGSPLLYWSKKKNRS